jgi:hypothetical protein
VLVLVEVAGLSAANPMCLAEPVRTVLALAAPAVPNAATPSAPSATIVPTNPNLRIAHPWVRSHGKHARLDRTAYFVGVMTRHT